MMKSDIEMNKAGFWIRLLATWVDCVIIYAVLTAVFYLLVYTAPSMYFPFNFTFFVTGILYTAVFIALKGQTIGKYLLGIGVYNSEAGKLPVYKALLRETILKIISGTVLFLGFFWIGFTKNKKGWHDYLVKSSVLKNKTQLKYTGFWKIASLASFLFFSLSYIWNITSPLLEARKMNLNLAEVRLPFMDRDPSAVTDIGTVKDTSFVSWLDKNAQSPEAYALQVTATHQITLFGEQHGNADNLNFINRIIPQLYHQSGIRVIGMETIPACMNKKAEQLVNGKIYDSSLALEIARGQCWKLWGYKEYWNVLKTVWQLNQSLPNGVEKMGVIGLDPDWVMPNISLLGISQDSKGETGFWEKFRFFSAIEDFPKISNRDKLMAGIAEKEIINKHKKAVILIGFNHTIKNFTPTIKKDNKTIVVNPRFALLLSQKYKHTFFQIAFHHRMEFSEGDRSCEHTVIHFIDSVMNKRRNIPAGFTIAASPFEKLRDNCLASFTKYSSLCYGDITEGLIFMNPLGKHTECAWQPGFITNEMFMKYKPMYDLAFGENPKIKFKNASELNQVLETWLGKNKK